MVLPQLQAYISKAHDDARDRLRRAFRGTLDPFGPPLDPDPADGYPQRLHMNNLKGYFGEILAARFAEYGQPHATDGWYVPAFPFRYHDAAITRIREWQKSGVLPKKVPGQSGDDCVAFVRDKTGRITRCLVCEAKCTKDSNKSLIDDAHEGVGRGGNEPSSIWRIVETLDQMGDPVSLEWAAAIRRDVMLAEHPVFERFDLVLYVCGQSPVKKKTWIDTEKPHATYVASRSLHAVEVIVNDVEGLIKDAYHVP